MFDLKSADTAVLEIITGTPDYDFYRLVDTETNQVYDYRDGGLVLHEELCYCIWNRTDPCVNCSSNVARSDHRSILKLEYMENVVYLISSLPVELCGRSLILELIKDVTDCLVVNDAMHKENGYIADIVQELNRIAMQDPYTALYNKNFAEQKLAKTVGRAKDGRCLLAAMVVDVDRFKYVNDTYGHTVGDAVLLQTAKYLKALERENRIWASRIGGDEFMVIFQDIPFDEVCAMARDFQSKIAACTFSKDNTCFRVTVSIGLGEFDPEADPDWVAFVDRVDRAMYADKRRKHG